MVEVWVCVLRDRRVMIDGLTSSKLILLQAKQQITAEIKTHVPSIADPTTVSWLRQNWNDRGERRLIEDIYFSKVSSCQPAKVWNLDQD
jgi:hypothetical protein